MGDWRRCQAGAYVNFKYFFLDFFTHSCLRTISFDGTHEHPRVYRNDADVSGWTFGLGIGYRFGAPKQAAKSKASTAKYPEPTKPTMIPDNVPQQSSVESTNEDFELKISEQSVEPTEPLQMEELKADSAEIREELPVDSMQMEELRADSAEYLEEIPNEMDVLEAKIDELLKSVETNI